MPGPLAALLAGEVWSLFLVFARLGAAFAVLPGFAELAVPPRVRLLLAGATSVAIAPVVAPGLPPLPVEPAALALIVGAEAAIGLFLGLAARMAVAAAQVAGSLIGYQISLASAFAFDPGTQQQGIVTSAWLTLVALAVLFAADLHHVLLRAVAESYAMFPAGVPLPVGDFAEAATRLVAGSFALGLRMAMPFLVYGILLFAALGLMQRLMPQMQVFFVAMPLQLLLGIALLAIGIATAMAAFVDALEATLGGLLAAR